MNKTILLAAVAAIGFTAGPAYGQTSTENSQRVTIGNIFGALFGDRLGASNSIEAQWAAGQTPLTNQRAQFDARVDSEVNSGALNQYTGARLKSDYAALVDLETRYAADRRFTSAERSDLTDRYGALTQVLAVGTYADGATAAPVVADGRAAFDARVNTAVSARRISRTQGTRLRNDYGALVQVEARYLSDGVITAAERADLDARLDALDVRLGDIPYAALTPRQRLDAIGRALPTVRLGRVQAAQLRTEYEDLTRLALAYERLAVTADERTYLESRLANLETRAGLAVAGSNY